MVVISGPHYLRRTHPIETKKDCIPRPEWLFISNLCSFLPVQVRKYDPIGCEGTAIPGSGGWRNRLPAT